jgi:hypothetical protein
MFDSVIVESTKDAAPAQDRQGAEDSGEIVRPWTASTAQQGVNLAVGSRFATTHDGSGAGESGAANEERAVLDSILDDLAADPAVQGAAEARRVPGSVNILGVPWAAAIEAPVTTELVPQQNRTRRAAGARAWFTDLLVASGFGGFGAGMLMGGRRSKSLPGNRKLRQFVRRGK